MKKRNDERRCEGQWAIAGVSKVTILLRTASRTIATLIMIFNPVDANVASIVWVNERIGPGLRHFIQDFSFRRYLCFFFFVFFLTFENQDF